MVKRAGFLFAQNVTAVSLNPTLVICEKATIILQKVSEFPPWSQGFPLQLLAGLSVFKCLSQNLNLKGFPGFFLFFLPFQKLEFVCGFIYECFRLQCNKGVRFPSLHL